MSLSEMPITIAEPQDALWDISRLNTETNDCNHTDFLQDNYCQALLSLRWSCHAFGTTQGCYFTEWCSLWTEAFLTENGEGGAWWKDNCREEVTSQRSWMRDQRQGERYSSKQADALAGHSLTHFFCYECLKPPPLFLITLINSELHCPLSLK